MVKLAAPAQLTLDQLLSTCAETSSSITLASTRVSYLAVSTGNICLALF